MPEALCDTVGKDVVNWSHHSIHSNSSSHNQSPTTYQTLLANLFPQEAFSIYLSPMVTHPFPPTHFLYLEINNHLCLQHEITMVSVAAHTYIFISPMCIMNMK